MSGDNEKEFLVESDKEHHEDELGEKCIYYAAVLGASMWASWITWMPFLHVSCVFFCDNALFLCDC